MDMVPSSLKPREPLLGVGIARGPGELAKWCVYLSEPVQNHSTAVDPSSLHPCLSVSMVSDLLSGEQVVNRGDQLPALQALRQFGHR